METARSVEELGAHFERLVDRLLLALDLRKVSDEADVTALRSADRAVTRMSKAMDELKKIIASGHRDLDETLSRTEEIRSLAVAVRHLSSHAHHVPPPIVPGAADAKENAPPPTAPSKEPAPAVAPLSMDEYNATPKYMLGRITLANLNKTVRDINLTVAEKYRLMRKKRKEMTPQEIRTVQTFKKQENAESQGSRFILSEDLKTLGVAALEGHNARQFAAQLTVLRHHKRLREIRGGGLTRLAPC